MKFDILCGKVLKAHGLSGYVRCALYNIKLALNDLVQINNQIYSIQDIRHLNRIFFILKLSNINSLVDIIYIKDFNIYSNRKILNEGEIYYQDLKGYKVFDENSTLRATVLEVVSSNNTTYLSLSSNLYLPLPSVFILGIKEDEYLTCDSIIFE